MSLQTPWLDHYPEGTPAEIDPSEYSSIVAVLEQSVKLYRDRPAYANMGQQINYGEMDQMTRDFAAWLRDGAGLEPGDRVAIMLPNILQYPIALFGALRAGLTVVNTNPMYTARELKHQLDDSGAKLVVVLESFAATLLGVLPETQVETVVVTGIGDLLAFPKSVITNFVFRHIKKMVPPFSKTLTISFNRTLRQGAAMTLPEVKLSHQDLAFLQYTGGTTGVAKGAILSHGNVVANMQQSSAWVGTDTIPGKEIVITALPLYHVFALTSNCLMYMKFGGLNYLITNPRDMPGFVAEIAKVPFTAITGVNTLFNGLLNTPGFDQIDFSSLKMTLGGGMAVQRSVAEQWKSVTGVTLLEAYGLTETSPGVCCNPPDLPQYNGCIGLPMPSTIVDIRDDDGNQLGIDQPGELCIKGPQVMQGYWQRPDETALVMTDDGYLKTGDIAIMSAEGFFKIVDRKKDMILVSGFNVYPNEIEEVVASHNKVLEVAAIGLPDPKSGEVVKICVVKSDPTLTKEELKTYCKEQLTAYKVPRVIAFYDELPKSNVGKILRRKLREQNEA